MTTTTTGPEVIYTEGATCLVRRIIRRIGCIVDIKRKIQGTEQDVLTPLRKPSGSRNNGLEWKAEWLGRGRRH